MSCIKFFYDNLVTAEFSEATASSEDAFFPATNIQDHRTTKVFRTPDGTTSAQVVFDFQTTEAVDSVAYTGDMVAGEVGFEGDLTIEANPTDTWGAPAFSTTLSVNDEFNIGLKTFTEENYRYWRVSASVSSGYVQLGKLFIGKALDIPTNSVDYGWRLRTRDLSRSTRNRYQQKFIDVLPQQRNINGRFRYLNKSELEPLRLMFNSNATIKPLWYYVFDPETSTVVETPEMFFLYGFFRGVPNITNDSFGSFNLSFEIEEAL